MSAGARYASHFRRKYIRSLILNSVEVHHSKLLAPYCAFWGSIVWLPMQICRGSLTAVRGTRKLLHTWVKTEGRIELPRPGSRDGGKLKRSASFFCIEDERKFFLQTDHSRNALDVIDRSDALVIWSRTGNTSAKPAFSATPGPFLASHGRMDIISENGPLTHAMAGRSELLYSSC